MYIPIVAEHAKRMNHNYKLFHNKKNLAHAVNGMVLGFRCIIS
jgi:hypothetical protein